MTDSQRDDLLLEIHADMAVVKESVKHYGSTLYGNGMAGLCADVQRVDQAQADCPARKAFTTDVRSLRAVWVGIVSAGAVGLPGMVREILALLNP